MNEILKKKNTFIVRIQKILQETKKFHKRTPYVIPFIPLSVKILFDSTVNIGKGRGIMKQLIK